ncbi:MAG: Beta-galactosidase C-terminal domain [Bacillota bacterium]|nr:Beta-galactosidase C-terminal domain [Bacillota bacterium]
MMNFTAESRSVSLPEETYTDVLKGTQKKGALKLPPYGTSILRRSHKA